MKRTMVKTLLLPISCSLFLARFLEFHYFLLGATATGSLLYDMENSRECTL